MHVRSFAIVAEPVQANGGTYLPPSPSPVTRKHGNGIHQYCIVTYFVEFARLSLIRAGHIIAESHR